ncbi:hypothetical protein Nmel_009813 [Mimus melanotis]
MFKRANPELREDLFHTWRSRPPVSQGETFHEEANFFVADTLLAATLPKVKSPSLEMGYSECHCTAVRHIEVIPTLQHLPLLYGFIPGDGNIYSHNSIWIEFYFFLVKSSA